MSQEQKLFFASSFWSHPSIDVVLSGPVVDVVVVVVVDVVVVVVVVVDVGIDVVSRNIDFTRCNLQRQSSLSTLSPNATNF